MAEPILWANKAVRKIPAKRFNEATGKMDDVFDEETGERLFERIPQRAHVAGDYDNPVPSRHVTWVHVLGHHGHEIRMKLTNAAADLDTDAATPRERMAKARYLGWIPVGQCPLSMLLTGDLREGQVLAKGIRGQAPCTKGTYNEARPCPHYVAERIARRALQAKKTAATERRNQNETDKVIQGQQDQTRDIVNGITQVFAGAMAAATPEKAKR